MTRLQTNCSIYYTVNHFRIDLIRAKHTNFGFVSKENVFVIWENYWNSQSYGELPQALKSTITAFFQENIVTGALATLKVSSFFYRFVFLSYILIKICGVFNFFFFC